jgi:hypothetical protein
MNLMELTTRQKIDTLLHYVEYYLHNPKVDRKDIFGKIKNTLTKQKYISHKQFQFLVTWLVHESQFKKYKLQDLWKGFGNVIYPKYIDDINISTLEDFLTSSEKESSNSSSPEPFYIQSEVVIINE